MKISEIIKERRQQKGLTQEQVATYLGVSAPAVNKWEHAATYPDITLLPPLARLLGTDLNTLLSFQADLTDREIGKFVEEVAAAARDGLDGACDLALEKAREFPDCDKLLLNLALSLDGAAILYSGASEARCKEVAEGFYERVARSEDVALGNRAKSMLISRCMTRRDYERAEALLEELPDQEANTKKQLKTRLLMERGRYAEAAELLGNKILGIANLLQVDLLNLMEAAWKGGRAEDAEEIAEIAARVMDGLGLWGYCAQAPRFQLAVYRQDAQECMAEFRALIASANETFNPSRSPLYRHLKPKEEGVQLGAMLIPRLLEELERTDRPEYDFLRAAPEFGPFLAELRSRFGQSGAPSAF